MEEDDPDIPDDAGDAGGATAQIGKRIGKWAKDYLTSGVKRIFVLACVPNLVENYPNVLRILEQLEVDKIGYKVASDLKLINILLGLQNHKVLVFFSFLKKDNL